MLISPFLKDINKKKKTNGGFNMKNKTFHIRAIQETLEYLCKKGDAVEFIQPLVHANFYHTRKYRWRWWNWYYIYTDAQWQHTKLQFCIPQEIFIDCSEQVINFNDYYASVMDVPTTSIRFKSVMNKT